MNRRTVFLIILGLVTGACHRTGKISKTPVTSGFQISGWVSNFEGRPFDLQPSTVILRGQQSAAVLGSMGRSSPIRADGSFDFDGLLPGSYSVSLAGASGNYSPIIPVVVTNASIRNIEMVVPRTKQIRGRITMAGKGPLPELRFQLTPADPIRSDPAAAALSPTGFVTNNSFPAAVPTVPSISLIPQVDGTFVAFVPEGNWNVRLISALPAGYSIKSLMYGAADILANPLRVRYSEDVDLNAIVDASESGRLAEVHGRLIGISEALIATGPISVSLRGPMTPITFAPTIRPMGASVGSDGTFIFKGVLPGDYSALVTGLGLLDLATARLTVGNEDVLHFEIEVLQREVPGQIVVEGGSLPTTVSLSFSSTTTIGGIPVVGYIATPSVTIRPLPDGSFRVLLPEGDRRISSSSAQPKGYTVKSISYGTIDVLNNPMKISKSDSALLRITLTYSPTTVPQP